MGKIIISSFDDLNNHHYAGGGARAIHKLAKGLRRKHEVIVISGNYLGAKNKIDGINYKHIGPKRFSPKLRMLTYNLLLPFYALKIKCDLWIESFTPPCSSSFIPLVSSSKVIGLCHMLSASDMQRKYKVPFLVFIEKLALKAYGYIICVNKSDAKKIKNINRQAEVVVIPNSADIELSESDHRNTKHILYLGRIEVNQKGIDLLLRAYKHTNSKYKLVIAGSGAENELHKLNKLITQLDLTSRVEYVGYVKANQKIRLIDQAIYLVIPSRFETFSVVLLEAFSRGKTAVCFKLPNLSWSKPACVQVPTFDIDKLSQAMVNLENDHKTRVKLEKEAYRLAQNYTQKHILDMYEDFINKTLGTQKHFC